MAYSLALGCAATAGGLNSNLHHPARAFERFAHAPGVVGVEGHGLFLVHVLPGLKRGNEIEHVLVLGRGDEDGVDRLVVKKLAEILILGGVGRKLFRFVQAARVNVSDRDGFHVRAFQRGLEDLSAAASRPDQGEADPIIRAQHAAGGREAVSGVGCRSRGCLLHECASSKHDVPPLVWGT